MLKKYVLPLLLAGIAAAPAQSAVTISSSDILSGSYNVNMPATYDFNSATPDYSGPLFSDTIAATRAQPVGSAIDASTPGQYAAVGPANGVTSSTLDLSALGYIYNISLIWGSVDEHNVLELYNGDTLIEQIFGSNIQVNPTGDRTKSRLVNLAFDGDSGNLTKMVFKTELNAFEFDNVNITSAVPEASTWMMMIAGFGVTGMAMRRRKRVDLATA